MIDHGHPLPAQPGSRSRGDAGEAYTAVRVAIAWRYFTAKEGEAAVGLLRRIIAILWKLTR